ncbi:hypothetical protein GCM10016272_01490 [Psychrobacter glaciei]|uniref:Uncharacterized protein n=1 Tax=Psychrobacter glaciei TaxID=619771 RepID=A0ABQ3GNM3_9GAMM|nr:hypothetical protein GCM10016272_01490 [Psychrobacter glaciei]
MKNRPNTTQQINTYIRSQQLLNQHLQLFQTIKKADRARQSQRSTFTTKAIKLNNVDYLNQLTHGVNQYE